MPHPFFRKSRSHKMFTRLAGNLTLNSTAWADLPTIGTTWDIQLKAAVDDRLRAEVNGSWNNEAVWGYLDAVTIVSSAALNSFGAQGAIVSGGSGVLSWRGPTAVFQNIGGGVLYNVVAGDLVAGRVTVRLRYKTLTAASKTLNADANNLLQFSVENIGPGA